VAANAYYSGKGFTLDLESPRHMRELLDRRAFDDRLAPEEIALAERFAHIVRCRRVFPFPFLRDGRFQPPSFDVLRPGGDPTIDRLCEFLLGRGSYLDIGTAGGRS
jgi:hypothetical protein